MIEVDRSLCLSWLVVLVQTAGRDGVLVRRLITCGAGESTLLASQ